MSEKQFAEIQTERLLMRNLKESDWEMISYLRTDELVNKFVDRPPAKTKEEALAFINRINLLNQNQESYYWTITLRDLDKMIGSIGLWHFSDNQKTAEIGYDLSPEFQGKGIMDEALKNILKFGFKKLNLDLIEAYTHYQNESSKNLLERNHFKLVAGKTDEDNPNNIIYEIKKNESF
jgi:ribosomal-protein-alanine N-acetyltransferase